MKHALGRSFFFEIPLLYTRIVKFLVLLIIYEFTNYSSQDSYALCRVFKKNIVIPNKSSKQESVGAAVLWDDDGATPETSRDQRETAAGDDHGQNITKVNPSEASSSDVTQSTPNIALVSKEDSTAQIASDEVNSSLYISNFIQV